MRSLGVEPRYEKREGFSSDSDDQDTNGVPNDKREGYSPDFRGSRFLRYFSLLRSTDK